MKTLTQLSVSISEEAEEAVSALMERIFQQPPSVYTDEDTRATSATIYLKSSSQWSSAVRKRLVLGVNEIRSFGIDVGTGKIQVRKVRQQDWAESWKRHFKPFEIGRTLLIKPSWSKRKPRKAQAVVEIDPGLSFGTGQHATTYFCLEQIALCRKSEASQSFLDIGTGSGILAIAAAKLGYGPVQAFDFDPESVRVSRENAAKNAVSQWVRPVRKDLTKLPIEATRQFDVVCANLIYDLLIAEKQRINNRLKHDGELILAGILKTQFQAVTKAYESIGFQLEATRAEKEWQSGRYRRVN